MRHVLLISVGGLHEEDFANSIAAGTCAHLAALAGQAVTYTDAEIPRPSGPFPGLIAQVRGATPRVTGVYYDHTFDRALHPPSCDCTGPRGSPVRLTGHLDRNEAPLAGNGTAAIDSARLPATRVHGRCEPLWPHNYLRVKTVFGVLRARGLRTA